MNSIKVGRDLQRKLSGVQRMQKLPVTFQQFWRRQHLSNGKPIERLNLCR